MAATAEVSYPAKGVGLDLPLPAARRNQQQIFRKVASREDALEIMRAAQARYDAVADSYEAIGIPRE